MPVRLHWLRRLALAGVVCHALILLSAPFEHHDLICHLKTPQHCTSCTASPVGTRAEAPASMGDAHLHDAGAVVAAAPTAAGVALIRLTSGRSPPA